MKFTPEVVAALKVLRDNAESDFERHRIDVLERDLHEPPAPKIVDETHQIFDNAVHVQRKSGHYGFADGLHRAVWRYFNGEIPEGCIIHHIDGNPANNKIENLQLLTKVEHNSFHTTAEKMKRLSDASQAIKEFTCAVCGKPFLARNVGTNKYCSEHCKQRADYLARQTELRYCELCGEPFFTAPTSKQRFCSHSCATKANVDVSIANLPKSTKKLEPKTCPSCGKLFQPRRAKQICCSRTCSMQIRWQQERDAASRQCPVCGKVFTPARLQSNQTYCSHSCAMKSLWEQRQAQNSPKSE